MPKGRRASRSRKAGRKGLFTRVYSPLNHLLQATRNVGKSVFRRSGRIVDEGIGAVSNTGRALVSHADMTVKNITRRKNRKGKSRSRK
jgi:hypothetical protein